MDDKDNNFETSESSFDVDPMIMDLHVLMSKLEGDDKCVVCNAIKALEKKDTSWNSSFPWVMLFIILMSGFNGNMDSTFFDTVLKTYTNIKQEEDSTFKI